MGVRHIDADYDFGGVGKVTGLPTPTTASDAVTKDYADGLSGGSASTGEWFFIPPGALTVDGNASQATANTTYIQDKLDNYKTVVFPESGGVTNAFEIDSTLEVTGGHTVIGQGEIATQIRMRSGANLDAIFASENWVSGSGAPATSARNIKFKDIGVDGQWLNRTTGTELQTSGLGHGFALAGYICYFDHCSANQTRGHGFLLDTSDDSLGTALGEGIENKFLGCVTRRTGLSGFHIQEGVAGDGGVTDGQLMMCEATHVNMRESETADSTDDGCGIFVETGGGWLIQGCHVYAATSQSGNFAGYAVGGRVSGLRHGIYVRSASGARIIGNQVADFGYETGSGVEQYGIYVQGEDGDRGFIIANNTIWTDEDNASNTHYAIRITTVSNATDVGFVITGNNFESRAASPAMRGIHLDSAGTGTIIGTVTSNTAVNVDSAQLITGNYNPADGDVVVITGNSWQTAYDAEAIPVTLTYAISDDGAAATALTTGTAKLTVRLPHAMTLTDVRASLTTASSSGTPTFDINEDGTSILSTKLTIDASETTSTTASTAAVISDASLADDAEITFDVDVAGTGAKGAKITLIGTRDVS